VHSTLETIEVLRHQGLDVGIGGSRGHPLVFAHLARNAGTGGYRQIGDALSDGFGDFSLMRIVHVGVQEADRHCVDAKPGDLLRDPCHLVFVQRRSDRAIGIDALAQFDTVMVRHERLRNFEIEIVQFVADLACDRQHVARALRYDESGARAFSLDEGVGNERRPVHELGNGRAVA